MSFPSISTRDHLWKSKKKKTRISEVNPGPWIHCGQGTEAKWPNSDEVYEVLVTPKLPPLGAASHCHQGPQELDMPFFVISHEELEKSQSIWTLIKLESEYSRVKLSIWQYNMFVLICWGCHNKVPHAGWLKQQKFIVSQFWRLDVQGHGVGSAGFF